MDDTKVLARPQGLAAEDDGRPPSRKMARWLVCASGKGGTTKTTSSLNLATLAAAEGLKVVLFDTDEQRTLTYWHATREAARHPVPTLHLVSIPLTDLPNGIRGVQAVEGADLVIIDTPPGLDQQVRIRELMQRADFVLVPTGQSIADTRAAIEFMVIAQRLGVKAAFLMSKTFPRWNSYREARSTLTKAGDLCPVDIRHLADIESCHTHGLGINEFSSVKGNDDFEAVWAFVKKEICV